MTGQIKAAIAAVFLVVILLFGGVAVYFHNAWVEGQETIARVQAEQIQLQATAKACSDNTEALASNTKTKDEAIKKAQIQANILAKSNEALAQTLLNAKPGDGDSCKAAAKLYQDYKTKKEAK